MTNRATSPHRRVTSAPLALALLAAALLGGLSGCAASILRRVLPAAATPTLRVEDALMGPKARRFLVCGHRGAFYRAPGNTLASFRIAVAEGADLLEVDVQSTRDGRPVLSHEPWPQARTLVTWRRIRRPLLTLYDALAWAAGRTLLVLDLKTPRLGPVVRVVRKTGAADRVIFFADSAAEYDQVRALGAELLVMVRVRKPAEARFWAARADPALVLLHGDYDWLSPGLIQEIHATGRRVFANSYRESWHQERMGAGSTARRLFRRGIDVIQTNEPASASRARDAAEAGRPRGWR